MAVELVLDASVSLAWFLKENPERAAYAAAAASTNSRTLCCTPVAITKPAGRICCRMRHIAST